MKQLFGKPALSLLGVIAVTVSLCMLLYFFDNKYTSNAPQAIRGTLTLSEEDFARYPLIPLRDGWEYYGGTSSQEATTAPQRYRLLLQLPSQAQGYALELPERFPSCRIYVNGILAAQSGSSDTMHHRAEAGDKSLSFTGCGRTEILVSASDFTPHYSGMTQVPILGMPESVSRMMALRTLVRTFLCAMACFVGIFSVLVRQLGKQRMTACLFGLICLFFVGYVSGPILKGMIPAAAPFCAVKRFSFCAMLAANLLLWNQMNGLKGNGYRLLSAALVHVNTALVMACVLQPHEPILLGSFTEMASAALVLILGVITGKEVAAQYRKSANLSQELAHIRQQLEMQRSYYPALQKEIAETKTARHDLRHHTMIIAGLLERASYEKLKSYLADYSRRFADADPLSYCAHEIADVLACYYMQQAKMHGIDMTLLLELPPVLKVRDDDLNALLSNLLENAIEACIRQKNGARYIRLTAKIKDTQMTIHMENSCAAMIQNTAGLQSAKGAGRTGCGLDSVRAIARRYCGMTDFHYDEITAAFISRITLNIELNIELNIKKSGSF